MWGGMSFGKDVAKRNHPFQFRLTKPEHEKLEEIAASYKITKSELVRQRLFGNGIDYVKSEINNAIENAKNAYQSVKRTVKNYFSNPEDIYAVPMDNYGLRPAYR